jgi:hypothetical protein
VTYFEKTKEFEGMTFKQETLPRSRGG